MARSDAQKKALREFADRVRAVRDESQATQEDVAERSGLHRTSIGLIERGMSDLSLLTLLKLAHGLGVDPSRLVDGMGPPQ